MWTGAPSFSGWPGCTEELARAEILTPENRKAAQELAEQSFVLLKKDQQILSLKKTSDIALVGPLADAQQNLLGKRCKLHPSQPAASVTLSLEDSKSTFAAGRNQRGDISHHH